MYMHNYRLVWDNLPSQETDARHPGPRHGHLATSEPWKTQTLSVQLFPKKIEGTVRQRSQVCTWVCERAGWRGESEAG